MPVAAGVKDMRRRFITLTAQAEKILDLLEIIWWDAEGVY